LSQQYDVVIVGGGLGGLLSGVLLAKEGMKVCILEKDKQIGGCLQTFSLHKKVFDSCVHYIGGLGEGHTLNRIFTYAGIMDKLKLKAFDENSFDKVAFGDEETEYPQAIGEENFVTQLAKYFPDEEKALKGYIGSIKDIGDHFPLYRLRLGSADEKAAVSGSELTRTIASITSNKKLQQVLTGNNLRYAGEAGKTPYYLHALVLESYIHSAHKIVPGSSQISKFLWQELQQNGGEVFRNCEVTKLHEEGGMLTYAEDKEGERFYGKHFVSNLAPEVLLRVLDTKEVRPAYKRRIEGLQQTVSTFMLNLVLAPGTVPMRRYNLYWNATEDSWAAVNYQPGQWPANYALFFTEDEQNPGFAESLSILRYTQPHR
jgi:all-trans-retinol 13,14-reductase